MNQSYSYNDEHLQQNVDLFLVVRLHIHVHGPIISVSADHTFFKLPWVVGGGTNLCCIELKFILTWCNLLTLHNDKFGAFIISLRFYALIELCIFKIRCFFLILWHQVIVLYNKSLIRMNMSR